MKGYMVGPSRTDENKRSEKMNRTYSIAALIIVAFAMLGCQSKINTPHSETVQGCVSTMAEGYKLTDSSGHEYALTGDSALLREQVGHEVLVSGEMVQSSRTPGAPASASSGPKSQLNVSKVKVVSQSCSSAH